MNSRKLRFCLVAAAFAVQLAPAADRYDEAHCLTLEIQRLEGAAVVTKILDPAYELELPFHAVHQELRLGEDSTLPESVRVLRLDHGGILLEGPPMEQWPTDQLALNSWFGRGTDRSALQCRSFEPSPSAHAWSAVDPYTGNLFLGSLDETRLDLRVIDVEGEQLAEIHLDLFDERPLEPRSRVEAAVLDDEAGQGWYSFRTNRLAGFVESYLRAGGESYARYVADTFLLTGIDTEFLGGAGRAGVRLAYLPGTRRHSSRPAWSNLRGLRTTFFQGYAADKPSKGSANCSLMPMLKLLEDLDCRRALEKGAPAADSCPTYSAMALLTELYRDHPDRLRERIGFSFGDVFGALVRGGTCPSDAYPMLPDVVYAKARDLDAFSRRAEKELNRRRKKGADPGEKIVFENALPPDCAREMERYVEQRGVRPDDLVELQALQALIDARVGETEATAALAVAQKLELFHLTRRLLDRGLLVGIGGDRYPLEHHAVLAYGWSEEGLLCMDSAADDEPSRGRTVIPFNEAADSIALVGFLRGEVEPLEPNELQLRRAVELDPENAAAWQMLGRWHRREGDHHRTIELLTRAVKLDPGRSGAWQDLADALFARGRYAEGVEAYRSAISAGRDDAYSRAGLGFGLRAMGLDDQAEAEFRNALEDDPESTWAWSQLGWALHRQGRWEEAEACFRRAIELEPERVVSRTRAAEFLLYNDRLDAAHQLLREIPKETLNAANRAWIGSLWIAAGNLEEAQGVLMPALAETPEDAQVVLGVARLDRARGEPSASAERLAALQARLRSEIGESEEPDPALWIELAYAQALAGEIEAAAASAARLAEAVERLSGENLYDLACIHALRGDPGEARLWLERAVERGFREFEWLEWDPDLASVREAGLLPEFALPAP